ncbi:MAG: DUF5777 family beta-barrel protein [Flavisolibacter sp.]
MKYPTKLLLLSLLLFIGHSVFAQDEDLLKLAGNDKPKKEYVYGAFKSTRVIMSQSMEMLRPGVLDFRILHRFGLVSGGAYEFFGLDGGAAVRLGLDYGISNKISVGIGRSSNKELDGFFKYRPIQQSTGPSSSPVSLVLVVGSTMSIKTFPENQGKYEFTDRLSYFYQAIVGRKFSKNFTLQIMPIFLHRNRVDTTGDHNDIFAPGIGGRIKVSKRVSLNADYYYVIHKDNGLYPYVTALYNPMSIGVDIETGGHVFQLHFTNSKGLNERYFLTDTEYSWTKGDIFLGFNISRAFQIKKPKTGY